MANIKHIHEVIFLIEKHNKLWTPNGLLKGIVAEWGNDVEFSSCSGTPFPKEDAIVFLLNREKVTISEDGLIALHPSLKICEGHKTFQA